MLRFLTLIEQIKVENFFLVAGIVFGISVVLITPPFQVADEHNHFARAYQVSEGHLVSTKQTFTANDRFGPYEYVNSVAFRQEEFVASGGMLPISVADTFETASKGVEFYSDSKHSLYKTFALLNKPLNTDRKIFIHFANTAVYSPIPYLPQSIGIAAGRLCDLSPLVLMYLGRLTNLIGWLAIVYCALKLAPTIKHPLLLLALMPMTLFQASSLSADACVNGFSFLLIALTLKYAWQCEELRLKDYGLLFAVSLVIALSKMAYLPLLGMLLLIPHRKNSPAKIHYLTISAIIGTGVIAGILWTSVADGLYVPYVPYSSSRDQLRVIIENPAFYFRVILSILNIPGIDLVYEFIGILGWLDTRFPNWYYGLYLFVILVTTLSETEYTIKKKPADYLMVLMCLAASFLLVVTAVYLYWTPVGLDKVAVQGRYFIPLSPLVIFLFSGSFFRVKFPIRNTLLYSFSICSLVFMLYQLIKRYYVI